jgi:hypothetical protein
LSNGAGDVDIERGCAKNGAEIQAADSSSPTAFAKKGSYVLVAKPKHGCFVSRAEACRARRVSPRDPMAAVC